MIQATIKRGGFCFSDLVIGFESMKKKIWIKPLRSDNMGNEHWIMSKGEGLKSPEGLMKFDLEDKLAEIFGKDLASRGTRAELYRPPTEEEIRQLREYAEEVGAEFGLEIRSEADYEREMSRSTRR